MNTPQLIIYWARRDFRLLDNPALFHAVETSRTLNIPFLPIFIFDDNLLNNPKLNIGYSRRKPLAYILEHFSTQFEQFRITCGKPVDIFNHIANHTQLQLFFNDDIEPYALQRDADIVDIIQKNGGKTHVFSDQLSISRDVRTGEGRIYTVFTPFKNSVWEQFIHSETYTKPDFTGLRYIEPQHFNALGLDEISVGGQSLAGEIYQKIQQTERLTFGQDHMIDLGEHFPEPDLGNWIYSETQALLRLSDVLTTILPTYKDTRDRLDLDISQSSTTRLSMALKWGLVSVRTIKTEVIRMYGHAGVIENDNLQSFISELIWREFYKYILFHFPNNLDEEFQSKFRGSISWVEEKEALKRFQAWISGKTGYPIVDAAMNQLVQIGWMHNRCRMIVASVLSKNLGVDWRWGQEYFRLRLVDLDEASNNGGWQWAASVGVDPKPIRIFNPYLQAEKFDPEGLYQSTWLPKSYSPQPIIDHANARSEALQRYNLGKK